VWLLSWHKNACPELFKQSFFILLLFILTANGFLPSGSDTTIRHHTQTKHSTQNYTINKGHTTRNEYDVNTMATITNTITII
jgi:hypothetical protein